MDEFEELLRERGYDECDTEFASWVIAARMDPTEQDKDFLSVMEPSIEKEPNLWPLIQWFEGSEEQESKIAKLPKKKKIGSIPRISEFVSACLREMEENLMEYVSVVDQPVDQPVDQQEDPAYQRLSEAFLQRKWALKFLNIKFKSGFSKELRDHAVKNRKDIYCPSDINPWHLIQDYEKRVHRYVQEKKEMNPWLQYMNQLETAKFFQGVIALDKARPHVVNEQILALAQKQVPFLQEQMELFEKDWPHDALQEDSSKVTSLVGRLNQRNNHSGSPSPHR
jgi:hypothetical protein